MISKNPKVFKQKKVSINKIKIKKYSYWNCIPHAIDISNFFKIRKKIANIIKDVTIPIAV